MAPTTCPSCGHAFPLQTRAMHACPNCGRPVDVDLPTPSSDPPAWLDDASDRSSDQVDVVTQPPPAPPAEVDVAMSPPPTSPGVVDPVVVAPPAGDPLDGWDTAPEPAAGRTPAPDWLVAVLALAGGALLGGLVAPGGRARGIAAGALAGAGVAVAARRMWTIDGPDDGWVTAVDRRRGDS